MLLLILIVYCLFTICQGLIFYKTSFSIVTGFPIPRCSLRPFGVIGWFTVEINVFGPIII